MALLTVVTYVACYWCFRKAQGFVTRVSLEWAPMVVFSMGLMLFVAQREYFTAIMGIQLIVCSFFRRCDL